MAWSRLVLGVTVQLFNPEASGSNLGFLNSYPSEFEHKTLKQASSSGSCASETFLKKVKIKVSRNRVESPEGVEV
jgi:hypothetical protein